MLSAFKRFLVIALLLLALPSPAAAAGLIRDAEIEHTLRLYSDPIFKAAGLAPETVKLFIIDDPAINAFVAGGANIFLHTGLILESDTPEMLIGVIAHETGHIAGGHLAQGTEQLANAQIGTILSYVLGIAAAVGGSSDAGAAIMSAGQHVSTGNLLSYTRGQEQAADQAALGYLDAVNISASGMLSMFEKLRQNEHRRYGEIPPYALTHPLSIDRIAHVRSHLMQFKEKNKHQPALPKKFYELHRRLLAKLNGFLKPPEATLLRYPVEDTSLEARYARSIALYRLPDLEAAVKEINVLIVSYPDDPFFHELKGQMLFENGRIEEAISAYENANRLLPDSPLILTDLARAKLAADPTDARIRESINHLKRATVLDNSYSLTWHMLAIAYGKAGEVGMARLAMAEEALLKNKPEDALDYAKQAAAAQADDSPARLRADDLKLLAQRMLRKKKDNNKL